MNNFEFNIGDFINVKYGELLLQYILIEPVFSLIKQFIYSNFSLVEAVIIFLIIDPTRILGDWG
jgi:hypothetical protein